MGQLASQGALDPQSVIAAMMDPITCREILDALPVAVYTTDAQGRLTHFNRVAVALCGRTPELGIDKWCITSKLYRPDGTPLPLEQCPMAVALKERRAVRGEQTIAERPDGTRVWFEPYPTPLFDSEGNLTGGINVLIDITARKRAEGVVSEQRKDLADDFQAIEQLQQVSMHLARAEDSGSLHQAIMDAAVGIMRSEFASLQMLYPQRGSGGELRLLAFRGFNPEAARFWEWVRADSGSTCGQALRTGQRSVAGDVEHCDFIAGTDDLATYLQTGIRAVQTTPLLSRSGRLVGMISTHWKQPHQPSERDLRLLDVLARQAADWMERLHAEEALRRTAEALRALVEESPLGIYTVDSDFRIAQVSRGAMPAFQNVQPIIGRDFADVMHTIWPDSFADEAIRIFRRVLETGEPYASPGLTEKRKDISTIESYEWQLNRVTLADGRFGVVCYYFDTT
ncbi:MAG TPA: PAS domain-containing protein, partial [Tepidisphaeraceae bacterium]